MQGISGRLPRIRRHSLVGWVNAVLTLVAVDEDAEEHVEEVDEELGEEHPLPEVEGALHFGHEFDEDRCATLNWMK